MSVDARHLQTFSFFCIEYNYCVIIFCMCEKKYVFLWILENERTVKHNYLKLINT